MANDFASAPAAFDPARPFRAIAIESASFETCAAALCAIPTPLPATHPPTLFLHGLWGYRILVVEDADGNQLYFTYPRDPA